MASPSEPSAALVTAFAEIASRFEPGEDYDTSVRRMTESATYAIGGCEAASLTLIRRGVVRTDAATSELAARADAIQNEEREGPCLDAAMTERWVHTADLAVAPRWSRSAPRLIEEVGVRSMLSCRIALDAAPSETLAGLNMYATRPDAFTDEDLLFGVLLSSLGGIVVGNALRHENLERAIESRQMIGEAVGILRAQRNVSRDDAFALLAGASQRMNVKLRDVAAQITESLDRDADPVL